MSFITDNFINLTSEYGVPMQLYLQDTVAINTKLGTKEVKYKAIEVPLAIKIINKESRHSKQEQIFDSSRKQGIRLNNDYDVTDSEIFFIYTSCEEFDISVDDFCYIYNEWHKIYQINKYEIGCYSLRTRTVRLETIPREIIACVSNKLSLVHATS